MQPTFTEKIAFVERCFGKGVISRSGEDIAVACPACSDSKKKKLSISLLTWNFHCWICNEKGKTLVPVLRKHKSRETLAEYRSRFLNQKIRDEIQEEIPEQKFEYPEGFIPVANVLDSKNPNVKASIAYLRSRGLTDQDFFKFRPGVTPSGRDPRRVFFVSLDELGEENYFVSRSIDEHTRQRYVNSNVDKTKIVFNECDIDWDSPLYLVEGIFDQIRLRKNSACLLGSTLSENSLLFKKIVENQCEIVLALDSDAQEKARKIANSLISYGCDVKFFPLFGNKDVGSMTKDQIEMSSDSLVSWGLKSSLLAKIGMIKSGSML